MFGQGRAYSKAPLIGLLIRGSGVRIPPGALTVGAVCWAQPRKTLCALPGPGEHPSVRPPPRDDKELAIMST